MRNLLFLGRAAVYVLSGQLHYWFIDGDAVADPGTLIALGREWNRWASETDEPCRILALFSPGGFEQYFMDLGAALADTAQDRATTVATIGRLRKHYGDEEQGPPS